MINEADIRDFLTQNLDIVEPNLKFIKKEFSLENSLGAGGRIDILAKDKFGFFVIIEIKKNDKTARQALHELQKYMALFKTNYGLATHKCRCILLSTDWHELLVPFSEFSRVVDYQIDGYQLIVNEEGIPIGKKSVQLELYFKEEELYELQMMHKHGIEYSLFEITIEQNTQPFIKRLELEEDDTISLLPITDEVGLISLRDFFIHNRGYIEELCYIGGSCFHFVS
ncbi:endonuclease NucS domain-containing protein [Nostoc sp. C110]|uniref:endonuclease NucS domain-containing protein n=1 Tax=Nostoc sp. C110 TaxID=3349876 RepID=UPI00370D584F